jgi:hypothetical protein
VCGSGKNRIAQIPGVCGSKNQLAKMAEKKLPAAAI